MKIGRSVDHYAARIVRVILVYMYSWSDLGYLLRYMPYTCGVDLLKDDLDG